MKPFLSIFLLSVLTFSCKETPTFIHLKGQLDGMGPVAIMSYDAASSMLGDSRDIKIHTDAQGFFDTIIPLSKPEYYSIRRNTLYLTPGDDMEIYINENSHEAKFTGKGAEVNEYMKYRLFPKAGSFIEAGRNIRSDFTTTKTLVDSLAGVRSLQLHEMKKAGKDFKQLEEARIHADIINSYVSYISYSNEFRSDSKEEMKAKKNGFIQHVVPLVNPLLSKIIDEKYLDVAVVRNVIGLSEDSSFAALFEGITLPERTKELYEAAGYVNKLRNEATLAVVNESKTYAESMKSKDFKVEVVGKITQASKLLPGASAIDITMEDKSGNVSKLSDYKGKVIYMDFWATWCGACIAESPVFIELSKKYTGKEIVFLQISTDNNREAWGKFVEKEKAALPQFISKDTRLKDEWAIFYIPRFILIDKNFNIVNAYAELPSNTNIENILNDALNN